MGRERVEPLTRATVIQIGLGVLLLGGVGYAFFLLMGFEALKAGIAAESLLILVVLAWTLSYLMRVLTGKMTFMEQRKRYREAYEKLTTEELQARFNSMSEEEQSKLLEELGKN